MSPDGTGLGSPCGRRTAGSSGAFRRELPSFQRPTSNARPNSPIANRRRWRGSGCSLSSKPNVPHLAAVLQQLPSGVIIAEAPSGRLLHYNEEAARLLRHPLIPSAAVHGAAHDCAIHPDGRSYLPEEYPIARALRGEVVKEENLRCRHPGSGVSYLSVTSAPVRDTSGQIVAAVSTLHDVSERRRTEVKRTELLRRLVTLQEEERHRIAQSSTTKWGST